MSCPTFQRTFQAKAKVPIPLFETDAHILHVCIKASYNFTLQTELKFLNFNCNKWLHPELCFADLRVEVNFHQDHSASGLVILFDAGCGMFFLLFSHIVYAMRCKCEMVITVCAVRSFQQGVCQHCWAFLSLFRVPNAWFPLSDDNDQNWPKKELHCEVHQWGFSVVVGLELKRRQSEVCPRWRQPAHTRGPCRSPRTWTCRACATATCLSSSAATRAHSACRPTTSSSRCCRVWLALCDTQRSSSTRSGGRSAPCGRPSSRGAAPSEPPRWIASSVLSIPYNPPCNRPTLKRPFPTTAPSRRPWASSKMSCTSTACCTKIWITCSVFFRKDPRRRSRTGWRSTTTWVRRRKATCLWTWRASSWAVGTRRATSCRATAPTSRHASSWFGRARSSIWARTTRCLSLPTPRLWRRYLKCFVSSTQDTSSTCWGRIVSASFPITLMSTATELPIWAVMATAIWTRRLASWPGSPVSYPLWGRPSNT